MAFNKNSEIKEEERLKQLLADKDLLQEEFDKFNFSSLWADQESKSPLTMVLLIAIIIMQFISLIIIFIKK